MSLQKIYPIDLPKKSIKEIYTRTNLIF